MRAILVTAAMAMILGTQANAEEIVHSVEIKKIDQVEYTNLSPLGWESDCTNLDKNGGFDTNLDPLDLLDAADIINAGAEVWKIIQENEPIVEARNMKASALPRGVSCWNQMSNWQPTRAETYQVSYKNGFGITVVDLQFQVIYTYGGQMNGTGRYLTNSTIQYSKLDVMWGYIFNADVEIPQVVNMGSTENPVAGMQLSLNWSITTRPVSLKKSFNSASFFIAGDGKDTQILNLN